MSCTVFVGARGGVGVTTAALALVRHEPTRRAILDLDTAHPAVQSVIGIDTGCATIAHVLDQPDGVWGGTRGAWIVAPEGYIVVSAPNDPRRADEVDDEVAVEIIDELRVCEYEVVVDGGSCLNAAVIGAVSRADRVVIVVAADGRGSDRIEPMREVLQQISPGVTIDVLGPHSTHPQSASMAQRLMTWISAMRRRAVVG